MKPDFAKATVRPAAEAVRKSSNLVENLVVNFVVNFVENCPSSGLPGSHRRFARPRKSFPASRMARRMTRNEGECGAFCAEG
jgi:hypothetical protein